MTESVKANIRYLNSEWREREDTPRIASKESRRANTSFQTVEVADARPLQERGELDLDTCGFVLVPHRSRVRSFRDADEVQRVYYPEIETVIRRLIRPDRVVFFHHVLRHEDASEFNAAYARYVHCDYSEEGAREIARKLMVDRGVCTADEAEHYDFAWYNSWQPIERDVQSNPLLLVDASTVDPADVAVYAFGEGDDYNRAAAPFFSERHRHYYFPRMRTDELIVLKQLDSRPGRAHLCPHTSFDDVTSPPDALRRRSIEVRILCLFERDGDREGR